MSTLWPIGALVALLLLPVAYLTWQSAIRPAPYNKMFELREPEPLRVSRTDEGWLVTAHTDLEPIALRLGASPEALTSPLPLTPTANGYTVIAPHPYPRAFFRVTLADGRTIQTAERILPLKGAANVRDVGGYPTCEGHRLAWGRAYRADELTNLTAADWERLRALGIRLVCDLRSHAEAIDRPDRVPEGIVYRHIPVFTVNPIGRLEVLLGRHRLDARFQQLYRETILDAGAAALGELLKLIANPANLPLLFHCTGGKDRTGIAAALLMHICGVARETIIADYTLTNLAAPRALATLDTVLKASGPRLGIRVAQLYPLMSARPALIELAFVHLERSYGSVEAYLRGPAGLTESELGAIRRSMLDETHPWAW